MVEAVFVSGATGFIAQHVVSQLLSKGYTVVGSVRSDAKGSNLAKLFNNPNFSYEVVPDIAVVGAFDAALEKHPEITVFLHTASPFTFKVKNIQQDLLEPAVSGTRNALNAIKKHGSNVKHVVITSSYAAITTLESEKDPSQTRTEDDWNQITHEQALENASSGYRASKTFAERAAWDFIAENKPQYALSTVNPSMVFGPQLFDSEIKDSLNTSLEIINSIIRLGPSQPIGSDSFGFVDVRDVAEAHLVAFEKPEAKSKRLLLNSERFTPQDILDILNDEFPQLKGKLPQGERGSGAKIREQYAKIDNSRTVAILGHKLIPLRESVVDSAKQILTTL